MFMVIGCIFVPRANWWLLSVTSGGSTYACGVGSYGLAYNYGASNELRVPVCFRITE